MNTGDAVSRSHGESAHLKMNKETIRRWIKDRDFPVHKAGSLFRFKLSRVANSVRQAGGEDHHDPGKIGA